MCEKNCTDCDGKPVHVPIENRINTANEFNKSYSFARRICAVCGKFLGDRIIPYPA